MNEQGDLAYFSPAWILYANNSWVAFSLYDQKVVTLSLPFMGVCVCTQMHVHTVILQLTSWAFKKKNFKDFFFDVDHF